MLGFFTAISIIFHNIFALQTATASAISEICQPSGGVTQKIRVLGYAFRSESISFEIVAAHTAEHIIGFRQEQSVPGRCYGYTFTTTSRRTWPRAGIAKSHLIFGLYNG